MCKGSGFVGKTPTLSDIGSVTSSVIASVVGEKISVVVGSAVVASWVVLNKYKVEVADEELEKELENAQKRLGESVEIDDVAKDNDLVKVKGP